MKKLNKVLIVTLTISLLALPKDIEAKTVKDFENEIAKYTADLKAKQDKVAKNDAEVAQIKKKIADIEKQIEEAKQKIIELQDEIEKSNKEIDKKKEETAKIMKYFQIINGDNFYLEYIFGATSIEDAIHRISVTENMTEHNKKVVKELTDLIERNKKQKTDLETKNKELDKLESSLQSEKERIDADTRTIKAGMPTVKEQIKSAQEQVAYFKKLGCGTNEDIDKCVYRKTQSGNGGGGGTSLPSTNGFYRPIEYGYLTQGYKGRAHMGVDIGSSNKSIAIYPIANGQVTATFLDPDGALCVKVRHNYNGRYIYSTYAHLRNFAVSSGQYASHTTSLGRMGSTGNSTGPHLHLEITSCDWKSPGGGCSWGTYQNSTYNPANFVDLPSRWSNR